LDIIEETQKFGLKEFSLTFENHAPVVYPDYKIVCVNQKTFV
jgi:hypothetical protein